MSRVNAETQQVVVVVAVVVFVHLFVRSFVRLLEERGGERVGGEEGGDGHLSSCSNSRPGDFVEAPLTACPQD